MLIAQHRNDKRYRVFNLFSCIQTVFVENPPREVGRPDAFISCVAGSKLALFSAKTREQLNIPRHQSVEMAICIFVIDDSEGNWPASPAEVFSDAAKICRGRLFRQDGSWR